MLDPKYYVPDFVSLFENTLSQYGIEGISSDIVEAKADPKVIAKLNELENEYNEKLKEVQDKLKKLALAKGIQISAGLSRVVKYFNAQADKNRSTITKYTKNLADRVAALKKGIDDFKDQNLERYEEYKDYDSLPDNIKNQLDNIQTFVNNLEYKALTLQNIIETLLPIATVAVAIINVLNTIVNAILAAITVIPSIATTAGLQTGFTLLIDKIKKILKSVVKVAEYIYSIILIVREFLYQFRRFLAYIGNLIKNYKEGKLFKDKGTIPTGFIEDYKGYKLFIEEEKDATKEVEGIKRHYCYALNKLNLKEIEGGKSYVTDISILLDEVKVIIDRKEIQS